MDITNLSIRNFLTVGHAELELDNRGLLLIQGENLDDTSAKSNGAGKSSIVDALCWCLYNETARGVSGDAVVNKTTKKDTAVTITLVDEATTYLIQRYRKDKTHKNQLLVWQVPATGASIDLAKGTDKETQEVVNKIMGCSLDVFRGAVYSGQEMMPDLPGCTDKQLKLLIEEAAGVEELANAYAEARTRSLKATAESDTANTLWRSLGAQIDAGFTECSEARVQHQLFEDGRKGRARDILSTVSDHIASIKEVDEKLAELDVPAMTARQTELNAQLAGHRAEQKQLDAVIAAERTAAGMVASKRSTAESCKRNVDAKTLRLKNIADQIGKPCGECAKPYCEHDLDAAVKIQADDIVKSKELLRLEVTDLKALMKAQEEAATAIDFFKSGMTDVSAATAELSAINADQGIVRIFEGAKVSALTKIDAIKVMAKTKIVEPNPWKIALDRSAAVVERLTTERDVAAQVVTTALAKAELYANAAKVFGPAGVRAHILDTVTPFLNAKTGEYLGALTDGNIHAVWSTLAKTAKGELKEKFNIEVSNDKGAESFMGLSGGEKRKVRLATAMALQDMVASRATKPLNLFVGDEIDHALDEAGLERLMTVLDKKAKERGTVLVISHNSLADWIDSVITVTKTGGISTVTGATIHGF